ncbi:RMD1 family protein [Methylocaldum sp. MU1018]
MQTEDTQKTSGPAETLRARAWFLGTRIDIRDLERGGRLTVGPLTMLVGPKGYSLIFRFGVVVLIGLARSEEAEILERLAPSVHNAFAQPESDEVDIVIDPGRPERFDLDGRLSLSEASGGRMQVVAHVLAKSCVLGYYERSVGEVFDRVERLAERLSRGLGPARDKKEILNEIGNVLLILTRTVGRVEVTEKPEIAWEDIELDRLYERLAYEYELRDRDLALSRKLELISRTAETYLDLVNNRQTLRVEWYIVILIVLEIILSLYEKFF